MAKETFTTEKKLIGFSLKLTPGELQFIEEMKAKKGLSAAENIRALINGFRHWFELPTYMVDVLRKHMGKKRLDQRQFVREVLAREYERIVHGEGKRR